MNPIPLARLRRALPLLNSSGTSAVSEFQIATGALSIKDAADARQACKLALWEWLMHLGFVDSAQRRTLLRVLGVSVQLAADSYVMFPKEQMPTISVGIVEQRYVVWPGAECYHDFVLDKPQETLDDPPITTIVCDLTALTCRLFARLTRWSKAMPVNETLRRVALRNLLLGPDVHGVTLLIWYMDAFADEQSKSEEDADLGPLHWAPETIRLSVRDQGFDLPTLNFDKLMAAIAILTNDLFWKDCQAFNNLAHALCGNGFDPTTYERLSAAECAWAVTEAVLIDPPSDEEPEPFSDEIRLYIGRILHEEGFSSAPDVLGIALHPRPQFQPSDDPEVRAAAEAVRRSRDAEIVRVVTTGLRQLHEQLSILTLRHGNLDQWCAKLQESLARKEPGSEPR